MSVRNVRKKKKNRLLGTSSAPACSEWMTKRRDINGNIPSHCSHSSSNFGQKQYMKCECQAAKYHDLTIGDCCRAIKNRSEVEADSIGAPVGLICSTLKVSNYEDNIQNHSLLFAINMTACALSYVLPEEDWTEESIDMLVRDGLSVLNQERSSSSSLRQPKIYTTGEKLVSRIFDLQEHTFKMELGYLRDKEKEEKAKEMVGKKQEKAEFEWPISKLREILQKCIRPDHYYLLTTKSGYLLIWQRRKSYLVFDATGRKRDDLTLSPSNGLAMLICLHEIDNIVFLVRDLSGLTMSDTFTLRELMVVRLGTPDGRVFLRDTSTRTIDYNLVDTNYAYLQSKLFLSLKSGDSLELRSSILIAIAGILAAKIDHPATWSVEVVDRIICYGIELCRSFWAPCLNDNQPIDLDTFPTQLRLGQFVVELKLLPMVAHSFWKCTLRFLQNDFESCLTTTLERYGNAVFQISNQTYAIWLKNNFYYVLDPYRHKVEHKSKSSEKSATVRMFRNRYTMLRVFHKLLLETNKNEVREPFYLHAIKIKNISICPQGYALVPTPDDVDDDYDMISLNETINFTEPAICMEKPKPSIDEIEEPKDDLPFYVLEVDLKSDSSYSDEEEEEAKEEAEEEHIEEEPPPSPPHRHHHHHRPRPRPHRKHKTKHYIDDIPEPPEVEIKMPKADKNLWLMSEVWRTIEPERKAQKTPCCMDASQSLPPEIDVEQIDVIVPTKLEPCPGQCEPPSPPSNKYTAAEEPPPPMQSPPRQKSNCPHSSTTKTEAQRQQQSTKSPIKVIVTKTSPLRLACQKAMPLIRSAFGHTLKVPLVPPTTNRQSSSSFKTFPSQPFSSKTPPSKSLPTSSSKTSTLNGHPRITSSDTVTSAGHMLSGGGAGGGGVTSTRTSYPGYLEQPMDMAVAGSESGTVESLQRLLRQSFQAADRVLAVTPWGNYVVFRHRSSPNDNEMYYMFDGCTCNVDRFRHLDLNHGTNGLLAFEHQIQVVCHMIDARETRSKHCSQNDND